MTRKKRRHRLPMPVMYTLLGVSVMAAPAAFASESEAVAQARESVTGEAERERKADRKSAPSTTSAPSDAADAGEAGTPESMPMTKTVVSGDDVDGAQDGYADAVKNVAGVTSNNSRGSANDSIKIRGIQLNLFTSYRLNGGLPIAGVSTSPTENKERIETLKGANALMFGIASPGGVVNLVTKRAGDKDVSTATLSGNSFGQYGGMVDLGRRFGDDRQFGLRVNASATHYENGVDGASGSGQFISLGTDWRATRDLKFSLDVEHYERSVVEQGLISLLKPVNGQIQVPRIPDPTRLMSGPWAVYKPVTDNVQARVDYALGKNWKVMAEWGQSKASRDRFITRIGGYDLESGAGTITTTMVKNQRYVNEFARTELDGRFSLLGFKHDLTIGVSTSERDANQPSTSSFTGRQNIFDPIAQPAPPASSKPITYAPQVSKDTGIYAYDAIQLHPRWKLLAGIRQTYYHADNTSAAGVSTSNKSTVSSPAVGLLFDVSKQTTLYASYMKGLEETGSAPVGAVNQFEILAPASATQIEFGVRHHQDGFNGSLAVFDISRANAVVDPDTNVFLLDGTNTFRGVEATASWDVNRHWTINTAGQYLLAEQKPDRNMSLHGLVPENTPKLTGNVTITHKAPWFKGLTVHAGASYVGARYVNALNQAQIPGVTLLSAGVGYSTRLMGRKASMQLNVENLGNKRYWNSVSSGTYGTGMERSLRFNAKMEF
ncbi:TonB-dependent siderophore receptor [Diaphorobacter caeni]|uniref:TonB-dependent siderophore receptor n=1 Tax=Diaphorobacter caeni TaxID=2784387 RepID=UPI00188E1DD1|nr:TonB-dependent siderophore receptor [Diaphorobacter caeni]MBF5007329.1 TonB-dependent siderophore receptor [Diaphorobacter caeni]